MKQSLRRTFHEEQGQSIVLVALALFALIGFLGLILDGGDMYFSRRDSQNASDAAAFAGARVLSIPASSGGEVWDAVSQYAQANHIADPGSDVVANFLNSGGAEIGPIGPGSSRAGATGVAVTTTIHVQTFFINVLSGTDTADVGAVARIQTGRLTGSPVAPVTVACPQLSTNPEDPCGFVKGQEAILKGDTTSAGNVQWISYLNTQPDGSCYGGSPSDLAGYLMDPPSPLPPLINKDDWVCGNTGSTNSSSIRTQFKYWVDQNAIHERPWIVPIYDCIGHNGICDPNTGMNVRYHVIAFGAFVLTGYDLSAGAGGNCSGGAPNVYPCGFNAKLNPLPASGQKFPCEYWNPTGGPHGTGGWVSPNTCVQGKFVEYTQPGPVDPGACNNTGLDICGMELKE